MARTVLCYETTTGRILTSVPVSAASWSTEHRGDGSIEATLPLGGGILTGRPELLASLEPWRCSLAIAEGDRIVEAGPIQPHSFDATGNDLKVKASGMRGLLAHRLVMGLPADWPNANAAEWVGTFSGLSLGTIAKRIVQLMMSQVGGTLPIVLPSDETAADDADHTRTYKGAELANVKDRLDQIMGVLDGPDIAFTPRYSTDHLRIEHVMRTGTEADPLLHQTGQDWAWDAAAVRGSVSTLSVERDPSEMAQRAWVTGAGSDTSLLIALAKDDSPFAGGYPLLESVESRSTVTELPTLARWADGNLRSAARPWMTWSATVRASEAPLLGDYRPGDWATVWVPADHPYLSSMIPGGSYRTRITKVSGALDDTVSLTFNPLMEIR